MRFHHLGLACHDIEAECRHLEWLGYTREGAPFVDLRQGVRGMFVSGGGPRIELLQPEPAGDAGVLSAWLAHGIKLYHMAYLTSDLSAAIGELRKRRAKLLRAPTPAVAFGGRLVAFLMLPNRLVCELIGDSDE